ncbi:MAG TPA: PadR family transcriptional regulator [Candidatus Limihabitans stercoravium]|nr:PadR family transcriptional regulator [Candidatus Limihabitans stercoravium]
MSGDFTFLKGNIETIILCSLYNGDKYGYEIAKEIKDRTENQYEIKQPTLYSYLKRLESQELIYSYWGAESNGGRRRYYKLTESGRVSCEQFMAEWKYHQTVMSNLVDDTANVEIATQDQVTPLFGSKQKRPRRNKILDKLTEQDLIAERLNALSQKNEEPRPVYIEQQPKAEEKPSIPETAPSSESTETVTDKTTEYVEIKQEAQPADNVSVATETQVHLEQQPDESKLRKFEVNQDDAEDFMQKFDLKAQELSMREPESNGENYQHVLMNVLGDQLDGMRDFNEQQTDKINMQFANDRPLPLEDMADSLAKQGIRMRIFNRTTSVYRSIELVPMRKLAFTASWITFAILFVILGAMCLANLSTGTWGYYVACIVVGLIVPIVTSFRYISGPAREQRTNLNFSRILMYTSGLAVIVLILLLAFVFGFDLIKLNNTPIVLAGIVAPAVLLAMFPLGVVIFNILYKKYSK